MFKLREIRRLFSVFRTHEHERLPLHRDGDAIPKDLFVDDFTRVLLHLRGKRHIVFADQNKSNPVSLRLSPGDAYSFRPVTTYHAVEYDDQSLALYVDM